MVEIKATALQDLTVKKFMILYQLQTGVCTISVSSRAVNPPSDHYAGKNPELEGMLWNGFKQVCSIFDAHIQKFKIYVLVRRIPMIHVAINGIVYALVSTCNTRRSVSQDSRSFIR